MINEILQKHLMNSDNKQLNAIILQNGLIAHKFLRSITEHLGFNSILEVTPDYNESDIFNLPASKNNLFLLTDGENFTVKNMKFVQQLSDMYKGKILIQASENAGYWYEMNLDELYQLAQDFNIFKSHINNRVCTCASIDLFRYGCKCS